MRAVHVHVRLDGWKFEWREVQASSLDDAVELARAMPDVISCLEASWEPGGVVT